MTEGSSLLYILLAVGIVLLVSVGLFVRLRRSARPVAPPTVTPTEQVEAPPTLVAEPTPAPQAEVVEPPPVAPEAPPAEAVPTEPPIEAPPIEAPPIEAPPIEAPPIEAPKRGRVRSIGSSLKGILRRSSLTDEDWEELEEVLLRADVGVAATDEIVTGLRKTRGLDDGFGALRTELLSILGDTDRSLRRKADGLTVWLVTGVNGAGKTTTIGKLASRLTAGGAHVVLAAADTFRAAADEQLDRWGQAAGATVVRGPQGSDPASVVFDGVKSAKESSADVLLVDTAGRLQTKRNLMEELGKIKRILERESGDPDEVLLVLDATTGQNGVQQARAFAEVAGVTGLVLTKLDGSAKGGIVIAVQKELGLPVKLVGLGEGVDDLAPFDPASFVDDLLRA